MGQRLRYSVGMVRNQDVCSLLCTRSTTSQNCCTPPRTMLWVIFGFQVPPIPEQEEWRRIIIISRWCEQQILADDERTNNHRCHNRKGFGPPPKISFLLSCSTPPRWRLDTPIVGTGEMSLSIIWSLKVVVLMLWASENGNGSCLPKHQVTDWLTARWGGRSIDRSRRLCRGKPLWATLARETDE